MIKFPLGPSGWFIIIEPANIAKMKAGMPLQVSDELLIAFTPDMVALTLKLLGKVRLPEPGEEIRRQVHLTPEQIDKALKLCQKLPEVLR